MISIYMSLQLLYDLISEMKIISRQIVIWFYFWNENYQETGINLSPWPITCLWPLIILQLNLYPFYQPPN